MTLPRNPSPRNPLPCNPLPRSRDGYTLMEVMVALVIVALSLGAVFQNLSQSRHTAMRSEKVLKAVRLAHNLFRDEAAIAGVMRDELLEEEIEGEPEWAFRLTAAPLVLKEFDPDGNDLEIDGIKELTLCILYGTDDRQQSFCFTRWR